MIIPRRDLILVQAALDRQAAVGLIGPRQVGKTTLALEIASERNSLYLDLESREDRAKVEDPAPFLRAYEERLVILDEIHRAPEIFQSLRGLIDQGRRRGFRTGRFLILGSASIDVLRQSGESLAGRIDYVDMGPLSAIEIPADEGSQNRLWLRGGFPDSYLARNDAESLKFRRSFIRTYLERDVAQFGPRIPSQTLERLWIMLAHNQGTLLNASRLAAGLSVSAPTISSYIDLLVDLLLVRRLPPLQANVGKRLVKSPKVYIRDSGLLHALLGIADFSQLSGHPVVGFSWEGFVLESILSVMPEQTIASFYRTAAGAEVDLILEFPGAKELWAIEVKRSSSAKIEKGFKLACEDLKPSRRILVIPGAERYPSGEITEAIGLTSLLGELAAM